MHIVCCADLVAHKSSQSRFTVSPPSNTIDCSLTKTCTRTKRCTSLAQTRYNVNTYNTEGNGSSTLLSMQNGLPGLHLRLPRALRTRGSALAGGPRHKTPVGWRASSRTSCWPGTARPAQGKQAPVSNLQPGHHGCMWVAPSHLFEIRPQVTPSQTVSLSHAMQQVECTMTKGM